jgi:hypothetical protein
MEYRYAEPPFRHNGGKWFGHEVILYVNPKRLVEFKDTITAIAGKIGEGWRLSHKTPFSVFEHGKQIVRFLDKKTAMRFKLTWEPCEEETLDDLQKLFKKIALNSQYGSMNKFNFSALRAASNPISQITPYSSGIYPLMTSSGKTMSQIYQAKSRYNRYSLQDTEAAYLDYLWSDIESKTLNGCKNRRDTVMTTEELKKRLDNGTES